MSSEKSIPLAARLENSNKNPDVIYFDTQNSLSNLCGMHALNNLLGAKTYTHQDLNNVCEQLAPNEIFNPHRHSRFTGDFDVNVLMVALEAKGRTCKWVNSKQKKYTLETVLDFESLQGYLLNVPTPSSIFSSILMLSNRHWITFKKFKNDTFVLLDSKEKDAMFFHLNCIQKMLTLEIEKGSHILEVYLNDSEKQKKRSHTQKIVREKRQIS